MKVVTMFESLDGSRWSDEAQASDRDRLTERVSAAMAPVGDLPEDGGCAFANGGGYVWHSTEKVESARRAMIDVFRERHPSLWGTDEDPYQRHVSHFARIADDEGGPLAKAFARLMRIDGKGREWGQPFYAINPGQGTDHVLEDRR